MTRTPRDPRRGAGVRSAQHTVPGNHYWNRRTELRSEVTEGRCRPVPYGAQDLRLPGAY
jgi:hypothetical protein